MKKNIKNLVYVFLYIGSKKIILKNSFKSVERKNGIFIKLIPGKKALLAV